MMEYNLKFMILKEPPYTNADLNLKENLHSQPKQVGFLKLVSKQKQTPGSKKEKEVFDFH